MPSILGERNTLSALTDPKPDIAPGERDIRMNDYVNDKIQTAADLEDLESLIAGVEIQHKLLEEQLENAKVDLDEKRKASESHTSQCLQQAHEFELLQASINERLMIVTSSDSPEEASRLLKEPIKKLQQLELAESYVELLREVDDLKVEARRHLPGDPKEALKPYTRLKELAISLRQLQEPTEGAAVHLVEFVENTTTQLWAEMKKIMTDEFEAILQTSKWPEAAVGPSREWMDCFEKLLDLQYPEMVAAREPLVLLPMNVLARPFVQQFRYHFYAKKATNDAHKLGDHFFTWFLGTVDKWNDFLQENITPVLAAHFRGNILAGNSLYINAVAAFVTALMPVLKEKVDSVVDEISTNPQLLSRFMIQLMDFDEAVRIKFSYDGGNKIHGWKGLAWEVMGTWFDRWSEIEKDFALHRYQEIIQSTESGVIDYDIFGPGKTKPTHGATQVADLIQNVTLQYKKLRKFSHKVRFLINIQAEILDQYQGRLKDSLDAYQSMTSTVGRTLHGVSKEQQAALEGVGGLESLCKVFGSAEYLITMLKDWSNDVFFVQLWDELQERAKRTSVQDNLVGEMTHNEVKDCTSDAVGSEEEGSVFDVTILGFEKVRKRSESLLIQAIKYDFPATFRQYLTKPQWQTIADIQAANIAVTPELDQPLQTLRNYMEFLHKALAYPPFRRIWRESFDSLEHLLLNDVVFKQHFTTFGAARLMQDLAAIQSVVDACVAKNNSRMPGAGSALSMPKLKEAVALLNLPLVAEDDAVCLEKARDNIFASNQGAAETLEHLGMTHLNNAEARDILRKRVEANVE